MMPEPHRGRCNFPREMSGLRRGNELLLASLQEDIASRLADKCKVQDKRYSCCDALNLFVGNRTHV